MSLCFMLTAGQGTRLKPYTDWYAKPTLPLLNLPLAHYGFYLARQGSFKDFLMNKHHRPDQIEKLVDGLRPFARNIATVDETEQLFGSGGGLWNARDILRKHEFFMVANGDEVLIPTDERVINQLVTFFLEKKTMACLLTSDHPELLKSLKPVWVTPDATLVGFGMDKPAGDPKPVHYTGYKVFSRKILDWLPDGESNIFYDVLTEALSQGKDLFHFHLDRAAWFETGNPKSFFNASQALCAHHWDAVQRRRQYFKLAPLKAAVGKSGELICEEQRLLERVSEVTGHVVLGANVAWPPRQALKNSIVFSGQAATSQLKPEAGIQLEEL